MGFVVGVDLGTTFTAAAVVRDDGRAEMVTLGSAGFTIPSAVFNSETDGLVVGETAVDLGQQRPERLAREFKRRLGDPVPLLLGGSAFPADRLTAELLAWVLATVAEREGAEPDRVVVTHPANWGEFKRDTLRGAIDLAGATADLLTEPEAAAIHYATRERIEPDEIVVVYDLGGGTFDVSVLARTSEGFETVGESKGIEHLGGIDLDHVVHRLVVDRAEFDDVDTDDPTVVADLEALRTACVQAKIASRSTSTSVPVRVGSVRTDVLVNRSEFEQLIRPTLEPTTTLLTRALKDAAVLPAQVSRVLLVGGSSRIPIVGLLVTEAVGRPVAVDADPKNAVALGAAVHASTLGPLAPALPASASDSVVSDTETTEPAPVVVRRVDVPPAAAGASGPRPHPTFSGRTVEGAHRAVVAAIPVAAQPFAVSSSAGKVWIRSADPPTVTAIDPTTAEVISTAELPGPGRSLQALDDVVLAPTRDSTAVLDVDSGEVVAEWEVDLTVGLAAPTRFAATETGQLVLIRPDPPAVLLIDRATGAASSSIELGGPPADVLVFDGELWVASEADDAGVVEVVSGLWKVSESFRLSDAPHALAAVGKNLWVSHEREPTITLVYPEAGTARVSVGPRPRRAVEAFGRAWVSCHGDGTLHVLDPVHGAALAVIETGGGPIEPLAAAGRMWVANVVANTVSVIDPEQLEVVDTIEIQTPRAAVEAGGLLYVPSQLTGTVVVIDPGRV